MEFMIRMFDDDPGVCGFSSFIKIQAAEEEEAMVNDIWIA